MSEEKLNLYQKLAKIRKMTDVIQKNKAGYGYKYVTEDEILARVTAGMDKFGVSLVPKLVPGSVTVSPFSYKKTKVKNDKAGTPIPYEENVNEFLVFGEMTWEWVNDENPEEKIVVPWVIVGQQSDASQTFGSSLTYASRYYLMKYFNIATSDDDPDAYKLKKAEASQQEEKASVAALVAQIDEIVQANVTDANRKALKTAITETKAIKENGKASANYPSITTIEAAQTVLAAVKTVFGLNKEEAPSSAKEE